MRLYTEKEINLKILKSKIGWLTLTNRPKYFSFDSGIIILIEKELIIPRGTKFCQILLKPVNNAKGTNILITCGASDLNGYSYPFDAKSFINRVAEIFKENYSAKEVSMENI